MHMLKLNKQDKFLCVDQSLKRNNRVYFVNYDNTFHVHDQSITDYKSSPRYLITQRRLIITTENLWMVFAERCIKNANK